MDHHKYNHKDQDYWFNDKTIYLLDQVVSSMEVVLKFLRGGSKETELNVRMAPIPKATISAYGQYSQPH